MRTIAFWFSLIFVFAIPWENMVFFEINEITGARLIGLLFATSWLAAVVTSGRIRRHHPAHLTVVAFVLWNYTSSLWTIDDDLSSELIGTLVQMALLSIILWDLYTTPNALRAGMQAYVLGGYVAIAGTIVNYITGSGASYQRYAATGFNTNDLGIALALAIPIAWYLALSQKGGKGSRVLRVLNYSFLPAALLAILLTASRGAVLATIPAIIFVIGSSTRLKPASRGLVAAGAIGILIAIQPLIPRSSSERLATIGTSLTELDLGGRVEIWREGLDVFVEHPLIGVGGGAFNAAVESGRSPHNTFLSILVGAGIIGMVLFVLLAILVVRSATRSSKPISRLWLTVILVWFIGSLSVGWQAEKPTWLFLSLIVVSSALPELRNIAQAVSPNDRTEMIDQYAVT